MILAALQVLEVLGRTGQSLAEALQGLDKVPQKTVNVRIAPGSKPVDDAHVQAALREAQTRVQGRGRAFLRPSGTEPVVRITVEADDPALVASVIDTLESAVKAAC